MNLQQTRLHNAEITKGISAEPIRQVVLEQLRLLPKKRLLDFGAGAGELLILLAKQSEFQSLSGADITGRPAGLPESIDWITLDLNDEFSSDHEFDTVLCVEVIEHLENPRETMRQIVRLLKPGGTCIVTTPNQESVRSLLSLVFDGHFAAFRGNSYPAHITALLQLDLRRIATECGLTEIEFHYTSHGSLPKWCGVSWQSLSCNLLRGKRFSDNVALVAKKR